jgi:hypothetical protein
LLSKQISLLIALKAVRKMESFLRTILRPGFEMKRHSTSLNFEPGATTAKGPPGTKAAFWIKGPKKIIYYY